MVVSLQVMMPILLMQLMGPALGAFSRCTGRFSRFRGTDTLGNAAPAISRCAVGPGFSSWDDSILLSLPPPLYSNS